MLKSVTFSKIAVIIPAYKPDYLTSSLNSLANQTDKDFAIYIGDDCSPFDLFTIIQPFNETLDITYVRFENNLGQNDLVAHWNRCLNLMKGEECFIMFSDDDLMEAACISTLKEALKRFDEDVFHFNLQIIDKQGKQTGVPKFFPNLLSSLDFFELLCSGEIEARIPEFAFKTNHFIKEGGFENFQQAIRTDNATVIKCAFSKGIRTVEGPHVLWRDSGINISSSVGSKSKERYQIFLSTSVSFFNWMEYICHKNGVIFPWSITRRFDYLFNSGYNFRHIIGTDSMFAILREFKHYPNGLKGLLLWLRLINLKVSRKFKFWFQKLKRR